MIGPCRVAYGAHPSQLGELTSVPDGQAARGTVVLLHGGFWRPGPSLDLCRPLAADLAARGWTCWNVEYRRVGAGGGWPETARDVAAALDHLAVMRVDTTSVVVVGHSAGGLLAAWLGGRERLPAEDGRGWARVTPTAVVAQAGVLDLATAAAADLGDGAIRALLGGTAAELPDCYRDADPIAALPVGAPVLCVHGRTDQRVPFAQSAAYVAAAARAGSAAALVEVDSGDHLTHLDPSGAAWAAVLDALPDLAAGRLPALRARA